MMNQTVQYKSYKRDEIDSYKSNVSRALCSYRAVNVAIKTALDGTRVFLIKIQQWTFFHVNFLTNESSKAPQKNINIFKVFYSPRTLLWDPRLAILTNP